MKNRRIIITTILFLFVLGNSIRIIHPGCIRTVEYVSIFAAGAIAGVLLAQIFMIMRNKK
jgi:hypothetical protein